MTNSKYHSPFFHILLIIFIITNFIYCQKLQNDSGNNFVLIEPGDTPEQIIEKAANVTPSPRQYEWQKLELTGFIHFGINTFDEVEWGQSYTDITKFNPVEIDVNQWVKVFKDAGFKLIIMTTKHHDGFCLWPSKYTDYDISNTPFQSGKGDIVRDLSEACRKAGLKFGVYLSPWDMHEKTYGTPEYNEHFMNQLTELLTNYGVISEVWFDGANGEGVNGKKQVYDWNSYYKLIRKLQPGAAIAIMGPDVRWVGMESGYGRQTEWSVLPGSSSSQDDIAANSQQQAGDGAFIPRDLIDEDLGSREKILEASSLIWYPAEIDVSIRPGWFYHSADDELVKSPYKLVDIYYNSVGLNGVLLLNIPPDKRGLIHENDIESLQGMRYLLDETFKENFAKNAQTRVSNELKGNEAKYIVDGDPETFWTTEKDVKKASIMIQLKKGYRFNTAMLQENILQGQRIEKFRLEYYDGQFWTKFAEGTTVGYKRLLRFSEVHADRIKIVIEKCRSNPTLSSFGIFAAPPQVSFQPDGATFEKNISFEISSDSKLATIYYTLDGSIPDENSKIYSGEISIDKTTTVTAIAVSNNGKKSLSVQTVFNKAKYKIQLNSTYDQKYPGGGEFVLVDGVKGSTNFRDGKWQGYNGTNLDLVIDLGEIKTIQKISVNFLRDINSFIFLPESVEFSVSKDNTHFDESITLVNDAPQNTAGELIKTFSKKFENITGRYIHVRAKSIGVCPQWHKGAGAKAWLFADEISIE
ncbi:MAG: alpha-L-fucosidase [Ignavibacteria bacterium]|jgi:alpha-L-fucosidase